MIVDQDLLDIPLGVECAWPSTPMPSLQRPSPRWLRLNDAWRRLKSALCSQRRCHWAG
jgi:hypothetical protein